MSLVNDYEKTISTLQEENKNLQERLEVAHRELAESAMAEVDLKFEYKALLSKWSDLNQKYTQLLEQMEVAGE
tara:strand:+ start:789 stop:1007 length:219 start_codon:yes stop_codon:yes gene_type:complete